MKYIHRDWLLIIMSNPILLLFLIAKAIRLNYWKMFDVTTIRGHWSPKIIITVFHNKLWGVYVLTGPKNCIHTTHMKN